MTLRRTSLPVLGACLMVLLAFLGTDRTREGQGMTGCGAPLPWRVAEVDPRFGLTHEEALKAVRTAVQLWEETSDRPLFVEAGSDGIPIRFVFDGRQERLRERMDGLMRMRTRFEALESRRQELQRTGDDLAARGAVLESDARAFTDRQAAHNAAVERWNAGAGGADDHRIALEESAAALIQDRRTLIRRQREFQGLQGDFREATVLLDADVQRHNTEADELDRAFPGALVESGRFIARVRSGEPTSREIEIYRYEGPDDLVLVLAHELGHALGLGHTGERDGVMREVATRTGEPVEPPSISAADRALLDALCADEP